MARLYRTKEETPGAWYVIGTKEARVARVGPFISHKKAVLWIAGQMSVEKGIKK